MKKFKIITASDNELFNFVSPCLNSIKKCGYEPIFYNLGGLNFGIDFKSETSNKSRKKFPKKPFVIKHALENISKNEWIAWIDIDCIMVESIDEVINKKFDIGLTFRKNHINSGVSFWQHNDRALKFLDLWCQMSLTFNGDQNALNEICNIKSPEYINKTIKISGSKVKIFDAKIYNNFFFSKNQSEAKILHYKSKYRNLFPFTEGKRL